MARIPKLIILGLSLFQLSWHKFSNAIIINAKTHISMKRIMNSTSKATAFLMAFLFSLAAIAQDKKLDVDIDVNKGNDNWYTQPWVWIVGAAVFILLLVALLRGSGSKE